MLLSLTNNPGRPLPKVTEIKLARTAKEIMPGIEEGLNQLFANIEGEFKIKMFPIAAKIEPVKHHTTTYGCINVRSHTPINNRTPPIEHPIFMPNLSRIQFAGKAKIGWNTGNTKTLKVTSIKSYWK